MSTAKHLKLLKIILVNIYFISSSIFQEFNFLSFYFCTKLLLRYAL